MTVVKDEHNKSFANSSGDESIANGQQQQRPAAPITVSSQDAPPHPSPPVPPTVPSQSAPVSLICRIPYRKLKLVLKPSQQTLVTPPEESKTQSQSNSNEPPSPSPSPPSPKSKTKQSSKSSRKSASKSPVKFSCFCYYCDRKFSTVELRQKHLDQIHSNQSQCKYCKKTVKRIQRLFDHYRRYHSDRFVGCFECFEQYETQSELESHNVHVGHTLPRQPPSQLPQSSSRSASTTAAKQAASSAACDSAGSASMAAAPTTTLPASVVTRSSISESLNVRQNVLPLIEVEQLNEAFGLPVRTINETTVTEDAQLENKNDVLASNAGETAATSEKKPDVGENGHSNDDDNEPHHSNLKKLLPLKCRTAVRDDASSEDGGPDSEAKEPKDLSELDISTQLDVYDRYLRTKRTRVRNRRKPSTFTLDGFAANLGLVKRLSNGKRSSTVTGSSQTPSAATPIGTKRLSGEKSLQKTYLCLVCGLLLDSYKVYVRHKEEEHSHIFSLNYELIGPELNELKHVNFLGFNRSTKIETLEQRYESLTLENRLRNRQRRRESRNKKKKSSTGNESGDGGEKNEENEKDSSLDQKLTHKCTKCSKNAMDMAELHQHILICSGLYEWLPKANATATAGSSTAASGSTLTSHSNSRKRRKTANAATISTNATTATCTSVMTTSTTTTAPSNAKKRKSNDFEKDPLPSPAQVTQNCHQTDSDSDENKPLAFVFKKTLKKSFSANAKDSQLTTISNPDSKDEEKSPIVIKDAAEATDETQEPDSLTISQPVQKTPSDNDLVVEDKSVDANHRIVIKIKKQQTALAVVVNDAIKKEDETQNSNAATVVPAFDDQVAEKPRKHKKKRKRKITEIEPPEVVRLCNKSVEMEAELEAKQESVTQIVNVNCCPIENKQFTPETIMSAPQIDDVAVKEEEDAGAVERLDEVKESALEETKSDDAPVVEEVERHHVPVSEDCLQTTNIAFARNLEKSNEAEATPQVPQSESITELAPLSPKTETDAKNLENNEEQLPAIKNELGKSQSSAIATEFYCDICHKYYKKEDTLQKHKMTIRHISKLSEIEAAEHSRRLELDAEECKERERLRAAEESSCDQKSPSAAISHRRFLQPVRTGPVLLKIPTKGAMKLYVDEKPFVLPSSPHLLLPPAPPAPSAPLAPSAPTQMQDTVSAIVANPKDQIMQRIFCKSVTKLSSPSSNDLPVVVPVALNEPKQINDLNHNNNDDEDMEIEKTKVPIETNVDRHEEQQEPPKEFASRQSLTACTTTTMLNEEPLTTPSVDVSQAKTAVLPKKIDFEQELRECIGVAGRKSQRKCTSGKQNVLVEQWSSDESFDEESGRAASWSAVTANGNSRTTSGNESSEDDDCNAAGVGRNTHRKRKRRKQCTTTSVGSSRGPKKTTQTKNGTRPYRRRIVSLSLSASPPPAYQWPPASPPSLSSLPSNHRNQATTASTVSFVPSLSSISSTATTSSPTKSLLLSNSPPPLISFSNGSILKSSSPPLQTTTLSTTTMTTTMTTMTITTTKVAATTTATTATKNNLAVKNASENGTEDDSLQQHGWIVGDSARKLVTLLAHSKSR